MCFPEAAGWVRISGLRISPVFLTLATFMIIFAFFSFVNAFFCTKKVQGSQVIKQDGFSDYQHHGVTIYGLEGVRRLNSEKNRSLTIGCAIYISKVLEKEVQDVRIEKEMFISQVENTESPLVELGNKLNSTTYTEVISLYAEFLPQPETPAISEA